jgi:hypothetical protein
MKFPPLERCPGLDGKRCKDGALIDRQARPLCSACDRTRREIEAQRDGDQKAAA